MPKLWVNQEGTWKQVKVLWVKKDGNWINPKIGIINQGGVGKQFYPDAQLDISYTVPGRYTYEVPNGVTNLQIVAQGGGGGGGMGAFRRVRNYVVWLSYETGRSIKGGTRRNYLNPIILPEGYFPDETVRFGDAFPAQAAAAGQSDWAFHRSSWIDGVYGLLWYPDTVFVGSDIDDDLDEYQVRWTSFEYGTDVDARITGGGAPEYGSLSDIYLPLGIYPESTVGDADYKVNFSLDLPTDYVSHLHIPSHRPGYYARRWVPGVPFKRTLIARGRDGYPGKRLEGNLAVTPGDIITVDVGGGGYPGGTRRIITGFTANTYSEVTTVSKTYTKSIDIVVPAGVTSLTLTATGAGGGAGGNDGGGSGYSGYPGATISGTLTVTPGANVSISIGSGGTGGSYATNGGNGAGGISELGYNGGSGGKSGASGVSGGGGGGGAATVIKYNGTIIAIAGGGGGGGGAGLYSPGSAQNGSTLAVGIAGGAGGNKGSDPVGTGANYLFTMLGVDSGGGGPTGSTGGGLGTLPAGLGGFVKYNSQSIQIPSANGCGLNLRNYWSSSSIKVQTYQSPRDAVFLVNSSNWTSADLTTLGITASDVSYIYNNVAPTISVVTDMDDYAGFGYYTITKSGTVTFNTWTTGIYTQLKTSYQGASGRQRGVVIGTFALPVPGINDLIVLAWRDNTGINNVKYTVTYPIVSSSDGAGGGGGGGGQIGGAGGLAVAGDDRGAYSGINGTNLLPSGWTVGAGSNGGAASSGSKYTPGGDGVNGSVTVTYSVTNTYEVVNPIITTSLFNSEGGTSTLGYNGGKGSVGGIDIVRADDKDEFKFPGEVKTYVVPLGVNVVYISATGGGGGTGGNDGGASTGHLGFSGQQIKGNLTVKAGDTISVYVGQAGQPGSTTPNRGSSPGGAGGICQLDGFDGGYGGHAGPTGWSGGGGGGGAATVITLNGTVVAVAAGGGGGGGGGFKSTGAGQDALTYNTSTNGENGQSKTGNQTVIESGTTKIYYNIAGTREFKVPTGLTSITVSIIGAGGSGGDGAGAGGSNDGPRGGYAGTVVTSTIAVIPGETLTFNIGTGGSPVTYGSGLAGNAGKPTTVYRGNTLLLSAAGGAGGGRNTSGTTLSKGDASAAPFNQPGGTFTWGGQGGDGFLGSGGGGVDGGAKYKTSGKGGDGAVVFEIPAYVTILEDSDGGGAGGGGGGYPTGGAGGKTRTGDVGAYSGINGKSLLPSGWIALDGGNPGKDGTAFISPSAKFDAGRVGGGGGGAATVIQKNGVTIAVAAGGGGGGAGLYADSLAQSEKYISSGTHAGGAAYTESDRNDRGVGGGGGGGGYNGGAGAQGFNFADEIGLVADYNWTIHDYNKCYDRQNVYAKIDADTFDTVLGRYLTTKFKSHYFKGTANSYAQIKYNSKFALTLVKGSNFSLEAWICATGTGQDPIYGGEIVNKDNDYQVCRMPDGRIAVAIDWNTGTDINLPGSGWIIPPVGTAVVPLNEAAYVVVSVANTVLNIYINGALAWTTTGLDRQPTNSTNDIYIGNRAALNSGFQGYITNVRFWNVARTAQQVKQDYDAYTWGGRPDWGPSSGYSGQSLIPAGWKEYLASGETFTTTVSSVIDLDRPSTWTLGTTSTVGEYTNFKYLIKPDDEVFKSNVLVFGYAVNSTTPETRSLTINTKVNLNPYNTLLYEVNKGTIRDWGQEPEPDEFLFLEYSLDGSTWLVVDKVLPTVVKANKWYIRELALTQRGIRSTDGVYLRFRQTRTGGLIKPRDTWAVSPLIAITRRVINIANPGYHQEFEYLATKGGDGLAMISPRDANLNTYYAAGTYSYTVPVGITELLVTVVGGGGGSASTTGSVAAGGAGGSGGIQEDQTIAVFPGETLTIEVGDGGAGGTGSGTASTGKTGGVSRILRGTTLIIEARGGAGGTKDSTGSGGAGGLGGTPNGDRGDNGPILANVVVSSGGGQNALGIGNGGDYVTVAGPGNPGAVGFVSIGFVG